MNTQSLSKIQNTLFLLGCALLLTLGTLAHTAFGFIDPAARSEHAWGSDDAWISYRYSLHLANGEGLVFNSGERVEGYSTFLYVILMGVGIGIFGKASVFFFSTAVNILLLTVTMLLLARHARAHFKRTPYLLTVLLFTLCPILWLWGSSGMEAMAVLLVQVGTVVSMPLVLERKRSGQIGLATCFIVSVLLRADGFILPLLCIGYLILQDRRQLALNYVALLLAVVIPYFLWRYSYYQDWLPNTYYAKVTGSLFTRLLLGVYSLIANTAHGGLWFYALFFVVTGLVALLAFVQRRRWHVLRQMPFEVWFAVFWMFYFVYVGGDLYAERFLIPLFPLGILAVARVLGNRWHGRAVARLGAALVLLQLSAYVSDARFLYNFHKSYDSLITLGDFLSRYYPSSRIALSEVGKAAYIADLPTLDMLGLNDRTIARQVPRSVRIGTAKYDENYVIAQQPALIITWIYPSLDMDYGLTRRFYEANGYRLRYVLFGRETPADSPMLDVAGVSETMIAEAINRGYIIGILERNP